MSFTPFAGSFTAAGAAAPVSGQHFQPRGDFNITLRGSFVATVALERSFDGGTTWDPVTYIDGTPITWSAPVSTTYPEPESGVLYRLNCTAYTSGPVAWRLSQ